MSEHALLSASASERWIACPGSVALCKDLPDTSSKYADEGTLAHELAADYLIFKCVPDVFYEKNMPEEMLVEVEKYYKQIQEYVGNGTLLVEKRVDYSEYIDVPDSFGTSDAIIVSEDGEELIVCDLKYGKGVTVDADENSQLMLYALGAINEFSALGDFKRVRLVISQPRLNHLSEWSCTIEHLMEFAGKAKHSAQIAKYIYDNSDLLVTSENLNPSEDACRWCKAKSFCPALSNFVQQEIESGFDAITDELPVTTLIDDLAAKMKAVPLIELFCKAVRAKVEAELIQGKPVDGFKLVRGKAGNRKWTDEAVAEETLKSFRLKQGEMYTFNLISPTTAEKLLKENPRRWSKVEELITRSEGKLSVASADDKRPAIDVANIEAGFDVINNEGEE